MTSQILKSPAKPRTGVGVRVNPGTTYNGAELISWYGHPLPEGVTFVGDETIHPIGKGETMWRCWWFKNGAMEYITLDADIPHEDRILTTLTTMRMSNGNISEREGGSTP
jgi:hypothetical protein